MDKIKKIIFFFIVLAVFVIPGFLFGSSTDFYNEINKPVFAPPAILFSIVWPVLYIIQSYIITKLYFNNNDKENQKLLILLVINGILNIMYMPVFFAFKSIFGGFAISLLVAMSLIIVILKMRELQFKKWYLEIPYLLWSIFALILSISIYFLN